MSNARNLADQVSNLVTISTGGSNFEEDIVYNSSSPVSASVGTLWVDSSGANPMMKVWDGSSWDSLGSAPVPIITGIAPDNIAGTASTAVIINGTNFESGSIVKLIDTTNTELFTLSTTFNNSRSLQFLTPALTASAGPYDIKVTNPDNQISILENALTVGQSPVWQTTAGVLGSIFDSGRSATTFQLSATDPDSQNVTYSIVSGSLPTNMSMSSSGLISGTAQAVGADTSYAFIVRATDTVGNYSDRSFSIITKGPIVQSFTNVGTTSWISPTSGSVQVLIVAGGGGGGNGFSTTACGGGGGAGGLISQSFSVTKDQSYTVIVGNGGAGGPGSAFDGSDGWGSNGGNSQFSSLTAIGGGGGANYPDNPGRSGGSGGGGGGAGGSTQIGGAGTSGQGNGGGGHVGTGQSNNSTSAGGGGGAGATGNTGVVNSRGGNGGIGVLNNITGTNIYYCGGGGGGAAQVGGGFGGQGGGGNGGEVNSNGSNGTSNTGGGGGGGSAHLGGPSTGGSGGSGIVIVRY